MMPPMPGSRLDTLLKLHAADPDDADVPYMIGLEHGKADDPEEAVRWLDRCLVLNASYHYAYFQKAKMLSELGEEDDACGRGRCGHRPGRRRRRSQGPGRTARTADGPGLSRP